MTLIQLTQRSDVPVYVNQETVTSFMAYQQGGTTVYLTDQAQLNVKETPEEVLKMLGGLKKTSTPRK